VEAHDKLLMPGIVDLHSDALEKFIEPRGGARFPLTTAISEFDKYVASCGVTTMYHCICFMNWSLNRSIRSLEMATEVAETLRRVAGDLNVRNRIHVRYDMPSVECLPFVRDLVGVPGQVDLLSLMDHTPGQGQYSDIERFIKRTNRSGSENEVRAFIEEKRKRQARIDQADIEDLVKQCRKHGISIASHDDDTEEKVAWAANQGITISEFPVSDEAMRAARARGMHIGFGAPNCLRGASHSDNVSARDALAAGCADYLSSDYAPWTMLHAVFALEALGGFGDLPQLTRLVTLNPAKAAGVSDEIGSIAVGKAADLILVDTHAEVPRISRVFVDGQEVLYNQTCQRTRE
jgi:alpha-D-ribose 1-methylphosphonate 5-triphosphate diphosphatase